ncbi:amidohydrolase family protein [Microbacterium sp. SYP-A9085]|uniref:N-acyl-D-amino-acid deacylase family protein n=1 Tax=Microbacterium sp. SYP-A9085 TaxID=2664454 RepID=UPI00129AE2D6|nr:amidohydrolase family protein [Microbacterium sp. SYP-A9085]MRH29138.1 amidohydrolase family protein [Microbacterium sp. SYP-A9085]
MSGSPRPARTVLRGGRVVDASGERTADVAIVGREVAAVGDIPARPGDTVVDCIGRLVLPGIVDAHSHADGLLGDDAVQRALLRQGVTTVIVGQDGVSYAPGDGGYAAEYFAAIDGDRPVAPGGGVAGYLAAVDGASRLNAAYLVPAGTVRFEVAGRSQASAGPAQRAAMVGLVEEGLRAGAVGLSTGLDYVPGMFQDADELAALCAPVARAGGVYVSHMRGGYEANAAAGIAEIAAIARAASAATGAALRVHVSHFHADADIVLAQLDALEAAGVDATFDAYPYIRGCSLMGMPLLPPELSARPVDDILHALGDPEQRDRLAREWFPRVAQNPSLGPDWASMITLSHLAAPELAWAHGLTIAEAAARAGTDPITFALDALHACRLRANIVMAVRNERPVAELARIFAHPAHMGGSDGIFIGAHPHPRARGTFARYLREYVRETGTWTWRDAVRHLSTGPAARFGLGRRGAIAPGAVADLIVVDPDAVADTATYAQPQGESVGIDDVYVGGIPVLAGGELTDALPGRGLRRAGSDR